MGMDLFEYMRSANKEKESPLAARLRPTTLDEVVGQRHIIGTDKLLYRAIKADKISSIIFYGPPGTGKTTLAKVIANTTSAEFTQINATVAPIILPLDKTPAYTLSTYTLFSSPHQYVQTSLFYSSCDFLPSLSHSQPGRERSEGPQGYCQPIRLAPFPSGPSLLSRRASGSPPQ